MVRALFGMLAVSTFFIGGSAFADEVKAQILKVDPDKKAVTFVNGDGKETTLTVATDCKLPASRTGRQQPATNARKTEAKPMSLTDLAKRVEFVKDKGLPAFVTVMQKDGKEAVTEIKIDRNEKPTALDKGKTDKR